MNFTDKNPAPFEGYLPDRLRYEAGFKAGQGDTATATFFRQAADEIEMKQMAISELELRREGWFPPEIQKLPEFEEIDLPVCSGLEEKLIADLASITKAGHILAEAASRVVETYDGTHRLALALSGWFKAIADQSGRGKAMDFGGGVEPPKPDS